MDAALFDRLACGFASRIALSRRLAWMTLAGGLLTVSDMEPSLAKAKRRKKRRRSCFGKKNCAFAGGGADYDDCDFSDSDVFKDGVGAGSGFRRADLRRADLEGADMSGTKFLNANLNKASFREADISGASMDFACLFDTDFTDVVFSGPFNALSYMCRTILPDGSISDRDCLTAPRCCGR